MPHKKKKLSKLSDLKDAPYNPREVTADAIRGLQVSLQEFGDLSGIVWNQRTGNLVCGHQRVKALRERYGEDLKLLTAETSRHGQACLLLEGDDNPTATFPIRIVDWSLEREKAANVAANSGLLTGHWSDGLGAVLDDIAEGLPELIGPLRLDTLALTEVSMPELRDPIDEATGDQVQVCQCDRCGHEHHRPRKKEGDDEA